MTDQEMIDQFLQNNKPVKCQDEVRHSNEQTRKSNIKGFSYLQGVNARTVKRFTCEKCGSKNNAVIKPRSDCPNAGKVLGKYYGDKWCTACRTRERTKENLRNAKELYEIKQYSSLENAKLAREILSITINDIMDFSLIQIQDYLNNLNFIFSLKTYQPDYVYSRQKYAKNRFYTLRQNQILSTGSWEDESELIKQYKNKEN